MQDFDGYPLDIGDEVRVSGSRDRFFVLSFEPERGRVELIGKRHWGSVDARAIRWHEKGPKPSWCKETVVPPGLVAVSP